MDRLTGVADIGELMAQEAEFDRLSRAPGSTTTYALALIDITGLRTINTQYGSAAGDGVLIELARRLRMLFPDACVARVGGDKFAVLVDGDAPNGKYRLRQRVRLVVENEPFDVGPRSIRVSVRVTNRYGPLLQYAQTQLLWVAQRADQVQQRLEFEQRLDELEKVALETFLTDQMDLWKRLHLAEQRAQRDALSGALNRYGLEKFLESQGAPYALVFIDIDDFGALNRAQGNWTAGDQALVGVARLLGQVSPRAIVARWGGDEFVVLLPEFSAAEAQRDLAALLERPEGHLRVGDLPVTFSGGVASVELRENYEAEMIRAQGAARQAKDQGGARILLAP